MHYLLFYCPLKLITCVSRKNCWIKHSIWSIKHSLAQSTTKRICQSQIKKSRDNRFSINADEQPKKLAFSSLKPISSESQRGSHNKNSVECHASNPARSVPLYIFFINSLTQVFISGARESDCSGFGNVISKGTTENNFVRSRRYERGLNNMQSAACQVYSAETN